MANFNCFTKIYTKMAFSRGIIPLWKLSIKINDLIYQALGSRTNNLVGEFAEQLVTDFTGGTLPQASNAGYDILLSNGDTIQVKARKVDRISGTQLSDFHGWGFTYLDVVLFNELGRIIQVLRIDNQTAQEYAKKRSGANNNSAYYITLTNTIKQPKKAPYGKLGILGLAAQNFPGVTDLTDSYKIKYPGLF